MDTLFKFISTVTAKCFVFSVLLVVVVVVIVFLSSPFPLPPCPLSKISLGLSVSLSISLSLSFSLALLWAPFAIDQAWISYVANLGVDLEKILEKPAYFRPYYDTLTMANATSDENSRFPEITKDFLVVVAAQLLSGWTLIVLEILWMEVRAIYEHGPTLICPRAFNYPYAFRVFCAHIIVTTSFYPFIHRIIVYELQLPKNELPDKDMASHEALLRWVKICYSITPFFLVSEFRYVFIQTASDLTLPKARQCKIRRICPI